tara:strand:- start:5933 stop:7498 length:1566 start_codon:yes stop_codon:yes gene_type:complete
MRIIDFLEHSPAFAEGDAKFIDIDNDVSLSYQEVFNVAQHIAVQLRDKGVHEQDVVASYAPNSVAAYCCIFAISQLGAIWLPLNVRNTLEANLKLLKKSDTRLLFVDSNILASNPELAEQYKGENCLSFTAKEIAGVAIENFIKSIDQDTEEKLTRRDESKLVSLFPTGGTTGDSKLAEWGYLTWQSMVSIQIELMPEPDIPSCYLVSAPMTHAAGVASFAPILQGSNIVVMEGMIPDILLSVIEKYKVTHLFLPPTAIYMLLAHEGVRNYDYSSLRYFWYAAAPMSVEKLKEAIEVFGPVMVQTYGQAESPMVCTFLSVDDHVHAVESGDSSRIRSCGKTAPHIDLAILDDDGNTLPAGKEGEIAVKGDLIMRCYFNNPDATQEIRVNGWQKTGDVGVFDNDGYLSIVDRKRDMIISGGFNVYPGEIEQLIWGHPAIKDCAVIGIPDEKWGEQVTAVVELKEAAIKPNTQEIIELCKQKLGSVKSPKEILIWDELPRSSVGKVLKKEIRKYFWDKLDRKI